jgi:hypothetical protein
VTIDDDQVRIERKYPFHGTETIIEFSPSTLHYQKFAGRPDERRLDTCGDPAAVPALAASGPAGAAAVKAAPGRAFPALPPPCARRWGACWQRTGARVVVDVSDEPVLGYQERFQLISVALSWGARYVGADFEFSPQPLARLSSKPSLAIIGTGKRVGKTAVSGISDAGSAVGSGSSKW